MGENRRSCGAACERQREKSEKREKRERRPIQTMKATTFVTLALVASLVVVHGPSGAKGQDPSVSIPNVIDLDPDNVKEVLNGMKITMAEFYAPWCGHCKRLVPGYTKLAEMVANDPMMSNFVQVVKADCDEHRSIGETFSVTGFPTLKILSRGIGIDESDSAFDYSGPRDAESMFNKLKSYVEQDKLVGRHEDMDKLAQDFMASDNKEAFLEKAKPETEKHIEGELYYLMMEKIVKKGDEYVEKEIGRIGRIIQKGSITRTKFADMVLKGNVLEAFVVATE